MSLVAEVVMKKVKEAGPNLEQFFDELKKLANHKKLSYDQILEIFRNSLISVMKKKYGPNSNIDVIIDSSKNQLNLFVHFYVVEKVNSPDYEISLEEAQKYNPNIKKGEVLTISESFETFTRIGAYDIKNVFYNQLNDLERELLFLEYKNKIGEVVTVKCLWSKGNKDVYVSLDDVDGIIPKSEQMLRDKYPPGKHIKAVIKEIKNTYEKGKGEQSILILSRTSPEFVIGLMKQEISEIQDGIIEIIRCVRDVGFRTKMIVRSKRGDVDPVGVCVGIKGARIQPIMREIHNERIDLVSWSENPANMISQSLSPGKVSEVHVDTKAMEALVVVPDYEVNKIIGPQGKNVKLASLLTGYKINVKTEQEFRADMSSPEARERLEKLFRVGSNEQVEDIELEEDTPLSELPGLTKRVIELLEASGIKSIEQLVLKSKEELSQIPGINKNLAEHIMKLIQEHIEIEYEEE